MKVVVDMEACQGNALCMGACPEVFFVDTDGLLHVLYDNPPDSLKEQLLEAERICPTQAIVVDED